MILLLFAALLFACLFSMTLPPSASLLAPTDTPTATITFTPTSTFTPTATFTPLPADRVMPGVTTFGSYTVYWQREAWESAVGASLPMEDFESDPLSERSVTVPYVTGNGFSIDGNGYPEIIRSSQLLPTGNLLHFRDWEQGITLTFPGGQPVGMFGFDYTSPEEWVISFGSYTVQLPPAQGGFVGFLMYQDFPSQFTLSSSAPLQGGLSMDNLAYAAPYIPSTSTPTPTPITIIAPTITFTPLPDHLITPHTTPFTSYTVYFDRALWESVTGPSGGEDFEREPFDRAELTFPYFTGNRFLLDGTSTAQILAAPELLDSGKLIHFRDFEEGLTFTFPGNAPVIAFGFDYTASEEWLLTFNQSETTLPVGTNRFVGIVMRQDSAAQFTLSGPQTAQGGLSMDNVAYVESYIFIPSTSTSTSTPELGTP
jgi:hypothetical protein